jgi:hypothetical protein
MSSESRKPLCEYTTGELYETALALRQCAQSWEPQVCLLGNVTAESIEAMCKDYLRLRLEAGISGHEKA